MLVRVLMELDGFETRSLSTMERMAEALRAELEAHLNGMVPTFEGDHGAEFAPEICVHEDCVRGDEMTLDAGEERIPVGWEPCEAERARIAAALRDAEGDRMAQARMWEGLKAASWPDLTEADRCRYESNRRACVYESQAYRDLASSFEGPAGLTCS
jgi:hypothetical protein